LHPKYGTWFVYRAVVVFDLAFPSNLIVKSLPELKFPDAVQQKIKVLTDQAKDENWVNVETLLKIRQTTNEGLEADTSACTYQDDLLDYFYPVTRTRTQVLEDAVKKHRESKARK